jgi:membrane-associated progesterone receptor component
MGLRRFVSRILGRKERPGASLPEAEDRDYSLAEIAAFDGSDPAKPLLIAIKDYVYDVTRGRDFYGPGGPYGMFAGKDCTRALAKMSIDPADFTGSLDRLDQDELDRLEEWIETFEGKYRRVGRLLGAAGEAGSPPTAR